MSPPFRARDGRIEVSLSRAEREILSGLPDFLEDVGTIADDPAAERLAPTAYPHDPEAQTEYARFIEDEMARARTEDRQRFQASVDQKSLASDDADAWMRVINKARLALAARHEIDDDEYDWERGAARDPEIALIAWLGYIQTVLIRSLLQLEPVP